jgi:hypothetical protein
MPQNRLLIGSMRHRHQWLCEKNSIVMRIERRGKLSSIVIRCVRQVRRRIYAFLIVVAVEAGSLTVNRSGLGRDCAGAALEQSGAPGQHKGEL